MYAAGRGTKQVILQILTVSGDTERLGGEDCDLWLDLEVKLCVLEVE